MVAHHLVEDLAAGGVVQCAQGGDRDGRALVPAAALVESDDGAPGEVDDRAPGEPLHGQGPAQQQRAAVDGVRLADGLADADPSGLPGPAVQADRDGFRDDGRSFAQPDAGDVPGFGNPDEGEVREVPVGEVPAGPFGARFGEDHLAGGGPVLPAEADGPLVSPHRASPLATTWAQVRTQPGAMKKPLPQYRSPCGSYPSPGAAMRTSAGRTSASRALMRSRRPPGVGRAGIGGGAGGVGCGDRRAGRRGSGGGWRCRAGDGARLGPGQRDRDGGGAATVGEDADHLSRLRGQFDAEADGDLHGGPRVEAGPQRADDAAYHVRESPGHRDHPVADAGVLEAAAPVEFVRPADPGPDGCAVVQSDPSDPVRHSGPRSPKR